MTDDKDKSNVIQLPEQQQAGKQSERSPLSQHLQKLRKQRTQKPTDNDD